MVSVMTAQTTGRGGAGFKRQENSGEARALATFRGEPGFLDMKTFLKVVLLVIAAVIAVKLLPLTLGLGILLGVSIVGLAAVGVSALALILGLGLVLAAVLSPIWIPVLAIVGLVALIKRSSRPSATA